MSLETAQFIHQLNPSNPSGADRLKEGDDHIRLLKAALKNTFPGLTGPLDPSVTHTFLNGIAALLVPVGTITLWHGAVETIPVGWALCDGSEVNRSDGTAKIKTPDLRGRVPVGADETHALGDTFGQYAKTVTSEVGGAATPTATVSGDGAHTHTVGETALTVAQMPAHNHRNGIQDDGTGFWVYGSAPLPGGSTPNSSPSGDTRTGTNQGFTSSEGNGAPHGHSLTGNGAHTHSVAISPIAAHSHSVKIDTSQPSIALHFIIKV